MTFDARKRIALQFLQGMHHIHEKGLLHRDVSRRNVLVKLYDGDEVLVKISDLGLVKVAESDFTHTGTEMKGTHRDPQLEDFGEFVHQNEMHGIGYVLQYIFTGRTSLRSDPGEVGRIVQKCTASVVSQRYEQVVEVIADIEGMEEADAVTA
ncbi:protein kinase domain-containing protein [Rhodococcus erythropolis]|uniref:protein kinase domain-containing protein n=1 Tax=Rhodococcus erythropolis TaxID=1833 RepID=UPI0022AA946D|nr:protein kinase [Rhodococcus erythropolis]